MPIQQSTLGCFFQEVKKEGVKKEEVKKEEVKKEEVKKEEAPEKEEVEVKKREEKKIKKLVEPVKIQKKEPILHEKVNISKIKIKSKYKIDKRYSYESNPFRLRMIEYGL